MSRVDAQPVDEEAPGASEVQCGGYLQEIYMIKSGRLEIGLDKKDAVREVRVGFRERGALRRRDGFC